MYTQTDRMSEITREEHVYLAKLAEQAERYSDMCTHMIAVVKSNDEKLSVEERNLLSVAYKNVIGAHRASWRIINSIALKNSQASGGEGERKYKMALDYKKKIEEELNEKCGEILQHLETDILEKPGLDNESKVFYFKMKGDYKRYVAEFETGDNQLQAKAASLEAYKAANEFANDLPPTHPIRLGLALNFSVFHYEIMKSPDDACQLAKKAFDDAIAQLDSLSEDCYKDSTLIMQLLRDNLTLWTSDNDNGDDDKDDDDQEAN